MVSRSRVLVIDNDPAWCARLKADFEQAGYAVETALGSDTGLALARDFSPQLVVLETRLEPLDGKAVMARLRQQTGAAIVFLTSVHDHAVAADLLWQGAADFVRKPCEPRELLARVRAILRRAQAWRLVWLPARLAPLARLERRPRPGPLLH
jgi:DNA-binding response OmpR family regulator